MDTESPPNLQPLTHEVHRWACSVPVDDIGGTRVKTCDFTGQDGRVPCICDLRFPVATVVAMVADGMTTDEILAEHPDLEIDDIAEAHARTSPNGEGC